MSTRKCFVQHKTTSDSFLFVVDGGNDGLANSALSPGGARVGCKNTETHVVNLLSFPPSSLKPLILLLPIHMSLLLYLLFPHLFPFSHFQSLCVPAVMNCHLFSLLLLLQMLLWQSYWIYFQPWALAKSNNTRQLQIVFNLLCTIPEIVQNNLWQYNDSNHHQAVWQTWCAPSLQALHSMTSTGCEYSIVILKISLELSFDIQNYHTRISSLQANWILEF